VFVDKIHLNNIVGFKSDDAKYEAYLYKIARSNAIVLITGETGVGKGVLANGIREVSNRLNKPFVDVNCGSISENLMESALFGHVKGAFTSAENDHVGYFEEANGGILFLDEITETTINFQNKLLKVLENKTVRRVGGDKDIPINVRAIFSTNKNLREEINKGNFRADLYYRISTIKVNILPLRERPNDIKVLSNHFREYFNKEYNKSVSEISDETMNILLANKWEGNVRELRNVIEHAMIISENGILMPCDLPQEFFSNCDLATLATCPSRRQDLNVSTCINDSMAITCPCGDLYKALNQPYSESKKNFEWTYLERLYKLTKGNINEMANISKIDRSNLYSKLKAHKLIFSK
jgi:DNA-binding NtrC family response regulator